jgi:hypothetical protein
MESSKSTARERRMAREQREAQSARFGSDEQILITQVVGSVMPDTNAGQSMVSAAYQVAAEFIENHANDTDTIDLTWTIRGGHFTAQYFPPRSEATGTNDPSY